MASTSLRLSIISGRSGLKEGLNLLQRFPFGPGQPSTYEYISEYAYQGVKPEGAVILIQFLMKRCSSTNNALAIQRVVVAKAIAAPLTLFGKISERMTQVMGAGDMASPCI
jgi:hypothetical protein